METKCQKCKCAPCVCEDIANHFGGMRIEEIMCELKSALANWKYSREKVKELQQTIDELREGLRKLEWLTINYSCPACAGYKPKSTRAEAMPEYEGHTSDCWLAKLIGGKP